jgi:uncharacterized protein (TIGR02145 family)
MKRLLLPLLILFSAGCSEHILRYHGRSYRTITAGEQTWMAENLATKTYRSGRKIPLISDYNVWTELTTPGSCYYKNDPAKLKKYGMLYNWYAVDGGNLCPVGWMVPTNNDWNILEKNLGGQLRAGGRMKAVKGWKGSDLNADDIGFNALPGGYRLNEDFLEGFSAIWWSSSPVDSDYVWGRRIDYKNSELLNTLNNRQNGFSVRCIKK